MEKETYKPASMVPEESNLVIEKILEKHGLKDIQEKGIERFLKANNPIEKREIFENLPGSQISRLIKEYAEGKIRMENLSLLLGKRLNIGQETAKAIAEELGKKLLTFIKPSEEKGEELPEIPEEEINPSRKLSSKDRYRELIE